MHVDRKLDQERLFRLFPRTVIGQLVLSMILVQVIVLVVFLTLGARSQWQIQTVRDTARVKVQAELLAKEAAGGVRERDLAELGRTTETMQSSSAVGTARILDVHGFVVAANGGGLTTLDATEQEAVKMAVLDGKYHHIPALGARGQEGIAPIFEDGRVIAVASVIADTEVGRRALWQFIQNAIAYSVCALIANILLAFLVGRTVAKPLTRLNKATQQVVRDTESTSGFPLPITTSNEAGQLTHSFNVMVRELKQQRHGLTDTLALLDSMLDNAPVGFAFFDRRHRYVRANRFLERMYGQKTHEHLGHTMRELYPGKLADELEQIVEHVFISGEDVNEREITGLVEGSGEEKRTWICNFYPVRPDGEHVRWVGMVMTEVTSRVREEEAMRRSEKLAAAGRLAASIAHEINNPLESVTNLLYLVRINPSLNEEALSFADMAQRELARVSEITQQTLRFYRSSTRPEDVALGDVMESVLTLHAARLQSANIRIQREIDYEAKIFGFPGELRQVFANLIGNAVDAMPGGGLLRIRVARRPNQFGECGIAVTVGDTGTGMSAETLHHMFEPFYTTKESTGTGLGLWVTEEIVAKHGGDIKVRSWQSAANGEKSGTVFRVFLPIDGLRSMRKT